MHVWCDGLQSNAQPANVLVDKAHKIAALVDWESTYAAAADFSCSPSWWPFLKAPGLQEMGRRPGTWGSTGPDWSSWAAQYEPRLAMFLHSSVP